MSFKRLHSDSRIEGILDAISSVTGEIYEDVTTAQMATIIRNIHQGAKAVWIGDQIAYDGLSSYDVEICYIIFDNNKIMRVYAGTVILYDDPVVWDYSLPTHTFPGTQAGIIDTELELFSSENIDRPFEMYVHISDYNGGGMDFLGSGGFDYGGLFLWTEGINLRFGGTSPEFNNRPVNCNYKLRRDTHRTLYVYDMDNEKELIITTALVSDVQTDITLTLGGFIGHPLPSPFILHDFRFRWLDT